MYRKPWIWTLLVLAAGIAAQVAASEGEVTESFFIDLSADPIALTHNGDMVTGVAPPGISLLTEPRVRNGIALLTKLRNADNEVIGFASELETFPAGADLLHDSEVVLDTNWTLMIPGRGSLYLHQQQTSISGELESKIMRRSRESDEPWRGEWVVTTTVGPRADGYGVLVGGAGEFEDVTGRFQVIVTFTGFEPEEEILVGRVEFRLFMHPPR